MPTKRDQTGLIQRKGAENAEGSLTDKSAFSFWWSKSVSPPRVSAFSASLRLNRFADLLVFSDDFQLIAVFQLPKNFCALRFADSMAEGNNQKQAQALNCSVDTYFGHRNVDSILLPKLLSSELRVKDAYA